MGGRRGRTYEVVCEDVEGEEGVDDEVEGRLVGEDLADLGGGKLLLGGGRRCVGCFLVVEERLAFGVVLVLVGQSQGFADELCQFGSGSQPQVWLVLFALKGFLCV